MLYSCTRMASAGVKGLMWQCAAEGGGSGRGGKGAENGRGISSGSGIPSPSD